MRSIRDAIIQAVTDRNARVAGAVADALRFKLGMTYRESFDFVVGQCRRSGVKPPELADWDALLYEADQG